MRKINLDFRALPARSNTRPGLLLSLLGMLMVAWMVILHNQAQVEQRRLQSLLTQRHGANEQRVSAQGEGPGAALQLQRAALVIEQLSFPWGNLLTAIEGSTGEDMALLSVQPDVTSRTVALDAEAKDWDGMVNYIKRLEGSRFFSDVHLVSHEIQQSDPQRPVRFKLSCAWDTSMTSLPSPTPEQKASN